MGVRSCSCHDCENIMCDTYVPGVGHICQDCQNIFKEMYKGQHLTNSEMVYELNKFIAIRKMYRDEVKTTPEQFFEKFSS